MPGFTPTSMFPQMWAATGVDYPALVDRLIQLALRARHRPALSGQAAAVGRGGLTGRLGRRRAGPRRRRRARPCGGAPVGAVRRAGPTTSHPRPVADGGHRDVGGLVVELASSGTNQPTPLASMQAAVPVEVRRARRRRSVSTIAGSPQAAPSACRGLTARGAAGRRASSGRSATSVAAGRRVAAPTASGASTVDRVARRSRRREQPSATGADATTPRAARVTGRRRRAVGAQLRCGRPGRSGCG